MMNQPTGTTPIDLDELLKMIGELYVQKRLVEKQLGIATDALANVGRATGPMSPQPTSDGG